jgi:hypothetical protein
LDSDRGKLYYYPDKKDDLDNIYAPALMELIRFEGDEESGRYVRNIAFEGITFTQGDRYTVNNNDIGLQHDWEMYDKSTSLIRLAGAENCQIKNCVFENSGSGALRLDYYCQNNEISYNTIRNIGGSGILLQGYGPGKKDVNRHNKIINNHIHNCGEIYLHSSAIMLWQSGNNLVARNHIHDTPYNGITLSGVRPGFFINENPRECSRTIIWDEIDESRDELKKHGQYEVWYKIKKYLFTTENTIEENDIHHTVQNLADGNAVYLAGTGDKNLVRRNYIHDIIGLNHRGMVRADDFADRTIFRENVFFNATKIGVGLKHNNTFENNIVYNIHEDVLPDGSIIEPITYLAFRRGPSSETVIKKNIFYGMDEVDFYEEWTERVSLDEITADYNVFYTMNNEDFAVEYIKGLHKRGLEENSFVADPLFVDPENGDFSLKPDSPALKLGFVPIDIKEIKRKCHT